MRLQTHVRTSLSHSVIPQRRDISAGSFFTRGRHVTSSRAAAATSLSSPAPLDNGCAREESSARAKNDPKQMEIWKCGGGLFPFHLPPSRLALAGNVNSDGNGEGNQCARRSRVHLNAS